MKVVSVILSVLIMISFSCCFAEEIISPGHDFYYYDEIGLLNDELRGEIYYSNKLLYESCGAQIVVVILNTTNGKDIKDYCIELFNKWGIGDANKNNGFLLLLAIQDDDYYACPGLGLSEVLSPDEIFDMLNLYLEPDFATKNYNSGIQRFFEAVFGFIANTYHSEITIQDGIKAFEENRVIEGIDLSKYSLDELLLLQQRIITEIQLRTAIESKTRK